MARCRTVLDFYRFVSAINGVLSNDCVYQWNPKSLKRTVYRTNEQTQGGGGGGGGGGECRRGSAKAATAREVREVELVK